VNHIVIRKLVNILNYFSNCCEERKKEIIGSIFKDFLIFNQENDRRLYNAVEGKKIILVDDYRTSGTSSKEMLRQLIDLGAKEILIFNLIKLGE
jgi:orotate phosphoribosyltransferase-like protein